MKKKLFQVWTDTSECFCELGSDGYIDMTVETEEGCIYSCIVFTTQAAIEAHEKVNGFSEV